MSSELRVVSWNVDSRSDAWEHLDRLQDRHRVQVGLLQECGLPPEGRTTWPIPDPGEPWATEAHSDRTRRWRSCVTLLDPALAMTGIATMPLNDAPHEKDVLSETPQVPQSHPGQWTAALIHVKGVQRPVLLISLYAIWERMAPGGDIYAEATLHRAVSDITPLLQAAWKFSGIVVAGDFNSWHNYSNTEPVWGPRYGAAFDRLAAYGLVLAGPFRADGDPALVGCGCGSGDLCRHVRTYRHQRKVNSTPYQNDYVFTGGGAALTECRAIADPDAWDVSDHVPILTGIIVT